VGADGIIAELLKGAEKPVSKALCKLIINVWSTRRVPAEWKEALLFLSTKAKDLNLHAVVTGQSPL